MLSALDGGEEHAHLSHSFVPSENTFVHGCVSADIIFLHVATRQTKNHIDDGLKQSIFSKRPARI